MEQLAPEFLAWQCIGCGRIDGPQPCIGICQDRKVSFVYASDYAVVLDSLLAAKERVAVLESLARRMAHSTPRDGEWERGYRSLQEEARRIMKGLQGVLTFRSNAFARNACSSNKQSACLRRVRVPGGSRTL
jgi:hypothetical protein